MGNKKEEEGKEGRKKARESPCVMGQFTLLSRGAPNPPTLWQGNLLFWPGELVPMEILTYTSRPESVLS